MLSTLILDNFKAFGTRQVIPLAPITLIFGANSSGKSTILQSLLLLKQTLENAQDNDALLLPKGDFVDLGSFRQMVFAHDMSRLCEISPLLTSDPESEASVLYRPPSGLSGIGFRFALAKAGGQIRLHSLPHYWNDTDRPACSFTPTSEPKGRSILQFIDVAYSAARPRRFVACTDWDASSSLWGACYREFSETQKDRCREMIAELLDALEGKKDKGEGTPAESLAFRILHDMPLPLDPALTGILTLMRKGRVGSHEATTKLRRGLQELGQRLEQYSLEAFLEDLRTENCTRVVGLRNFLSDSVVVKASDRDRSLLYYRHRPRPRSTFPDVPIWSNQLAAELRQVLETLVYLGPIREYPQRHYIFRGNPARNVGKSGQLLPDVLFTRPKLVERTNRALRAFEAGYVLRVHRVRDRQIEDVFGLRLIDQNTRTAVSMLDVGFGMSQVLPIIVQSMLSKEQLILIEQPEVHLHPRLQAELGTLFAECIKEPNKNQFLIETHSEHVILRLQRLIREGELRASDVSVIYVLKGEEGSQCQTLRLDEHGDFIEDWPEGFFEEGFEEMFA